MSPSLLTRPHLQGVTLVAVTSVALDETARALSLSLRQADFERALLLSDRPPPGGLERGVEWRAIQPLQSRDAYSRFVFSQLVAHIDTPHLLLVQWDGYVVDGGKWDPSFCHYDYIGAPWPHLQGSNVGNGGFSLRSLRLLEALTSETLLDGEQEDLAICRRLRPRLEDEFGIHFALPDVATRFAWERLPRSGQQFGFHGVFNMPALMAPRALCDLLEGMEPSLVHLNERRELVWAMLRRGNLLAAGRLLRHFRNR